jgi:predicted Kef-type K+ transport protein
LAQIGEFSLILVQVGNEAGLTPAAAGSDGLQIFIAVAVLLIAATPLLYNLAGTAYDVAGRSAPVNA